MDSKPASLDACASTVRKPRRNSGRGGWWWLWVVLLLAMGAGGWWLTRAKAIVVKTATVQGGIPAATAAAPC